MSDDKTLRLNQIVVATRTIEDPGPEGYLIFKGRQGLVKALTTKDVTVDIGGGRWVIASRDAWEPWEGPPEHCRAARPCCARAPGDWEAVAVESSAPPVCRVTITGSATPLKAETAELVFPDGSRMDVTNVVVTEHHKRFIEFLEKLGDDSVRVRVRPDGYYIRRIPREDGEEGRGKMECNFKFGLGDKLRDRVTGFEGIAMCVTEWFNGCIRYGLRTTALKDNKPIDLESFDEQELELVEAGAVPRDVPEEPEGEKATKEKKKPGGPRPTPPRHH